MAADFDVIILGAGISGLVSASILAEQGAQRIAVIDEYGHVGGNHIDVSIDDYTFDVGSFIFQDDSPLLRHFPELLPRYVPIRPTFARLNPQGQVAQYPISINDDLLAAGPLECSRILFSVAFARLFQKEQRNARGYARYWIGERLLKRSGLEHYMERFYGVPAQDIDVAFARARMFWIAENARILTHVRSGFAELYAPAKARLEACGVQFLLGARLARLDASPGRFELVMDGQTLTSARLISTIPIARLQALCGLPVEPLKTVTMLSLFYSFAGARGFDRSILFNFSHHGAWKRLTMHSDFYGRAQDREYMSVEVNASHVADSAEVAAADFRAHTEASGLFRGDLKLEGHHRLATAYPVYTENAGARAGAALQDLRALGVESFGRQGGFDYQPTARVSTLVAEAALS